jgi:hypothetical protein
MFRVNIKTNTSRSIKPYESLGDDKYRWHWNTLLAASPNRPGAIYTASQYLFRTEDQGKSWTKLSPDLTTNNKAKQKQEDSGGLSADNTSAENHCIIYSFDESPLDKNMIVIGTDDGNLQLTTNDGKTWTNLTTNYAAAGIPSGTWVSSVDASSHDKNVIFATFDNHTYGDHKTYAAVSKDMGKTWTMFDSKEFSGFANKIVQDIVNPNLLFLGTEMGLFMSFDMGANWVRYKASFPWYAMVRDISIHEASNDVIIATHGRGIYIIDDITSLRSLSKIDLNSPIAFLDSRPGINSNGLLGGNQAFNAGEFIGANYTDIVVLPYYLKDRANTETMKIFIKDAQGNIIRDLDGGKAKGVNKVYWDMRMKAPKGPEGGTKLGSGGFSGPLVLPGTYTASIEIAGKIYEHKFEVAENPYADYTREDRQKQFDMSMQIYKEYEGLGVTTDKINKTQKEIDDLLKNPSLNKKLITQLQTYRDSLENVRKFILPTKKTSIFADEDILRERIGEVYGAILSYEGVPNNTIAQKMEVLKKEINDTNARVEKSNKTYLEKINNQLLEAKLPKLTGMDTPQMRP